ncbi:MAG: hypothetical protein GY820_47055 [Gammaproteobacteria bacterium]|nr:hypothetical protein [Gammaproteobacteria bacterium]
MSFKLRVLRDFILDARVGVSSLNRFFYPILRKFENRSKMVFSREEKAIVSYRVNHGWGKKNCEILKDKDWPI